MTMKIYQFIECLEKSNLKTAKTIGNMMASIIPNAWCNIPADSRVIIQQNIVTVSRQ